MVRDKAEDVIASLSFGDTVEIKWIDAARCYPVKPSEITNKVFATYKRRIGTFWGIKYDKLYKQPYFIICVDQDEGIIESIPLRSIVTAQRLTRGQKLKVVNDAGDVFLGGGRIKYLTRKDGVGMYEEGQEKDY